MGSADFFGVLGIARYLGRTFYTGEDQQRAAVLVLSHEFGRRNFGGDLTVLGRRVCHVVDRLVRAGGPSHRNGDRVLMSTRVLAVTALCAIAAAVPTAATAQASNDGLLVSTSWLAERLGDPSIVIVHVGNPSAYEEGHITGARYLDFEAFTERHEPLYTELPEPARLQEVLEGIGLSDDSHIVLYQPRGHPTIAGRLFVTLDYLGHGDHTSLLDGGLTAWTAEGRPLSQDTPQIVPGSLTVRPRQDVVVHYEWVLAHFRDPSVVTLDARTPEFYTGAAGVTMHAFRPGHIPAAGNVPFTTLTDEAGHFKRSQVLRDMFVQSGAVSGKRVVTYCHLGQQASLLYFIARYLGYDASMYDGSFEDWSRREDAPVER